MACSSHQLAHLHLPFLEQEMLTMIHKGQWMILPYKAVANIPNLHLSPLGVIPQCKHQPQTIADYTFSGINAGTIPLMDHMPLQFGRALACILQWIVSSNPALSLVYLRKIDLANGFYCILLAPRHIPILGVVFPTALGAARLVAFPLALPMGWTSSPPLFCTATKTVTNLTNATLNQGQAQSPHNLEKAADPFPMEGTQIATHNAPPPEPQGTIMTTAQATWCNVFVDDHMALAQGYPGHLNQTHHTIMHNINHVFKLLEQFDQPTHQEPISCKKLAAGDGQWSMQKNIVGWCLDTTRMMLSLPLHWVAQLHKHLDSIPWHHTCIATRHWHQVLGEL